MTPLLHPIINAEKAYNKSHIKIGARIEQAFGLLKQRLRCLQIPFRKRLNNSLVIIVATFCLQNFALHRNEANPLLEDFNIAPELDSKNSTSFSFGYKAEQFDKD